jgi:mono/diheme cytochrome c family protein
VPAAPKVEPPKPDPIYVQAAKRRRRIPIWAMPVLAAIPLWSYVYVRTLEPAPIENDPFELGAEHFTPCAACHGGKGQGAGAPQLSDGKVQETWGDYRDHIMWVKLGADKWPGQTYGDDAVSKDANGSKMPSYGSSLTDQEIAQVVLYERRVLSNEEPPEGEDDLLAIANGEKTFAEVVADQGLGPTAIRDGVPESEAEG